MKDDDKCFIKVENGTFEEISYKELENRRKRVEEYKNKKFIYIHGMLMEVSEEEYRDYYQEIERNRYAKRVIRKLKPISIEEIKETMDFRDKDVLKDLKFNIEDEVAKKIQIEQLKIALLELTGKEYEIIKALFYKEDTIREYAKEIGTPFTTIQSQKQKILEKLKKLLKI